MEELEKIRQQQGYISEADMVRLSDQMNISKASIYGIISFYSRFYLEPKGQHIIRVCKSVVCGMNASHILLETIEEQLNIKAGETSVDGLFTLEVMECLGQCALAPAMTIDDQVYGNLTPDIVREIIRAYQYQEVV